MVLPDGASSVVGVDAALSVRQLVERLLQRLNLPCPNYDVIIRDDQVSVEDRLMFNDFNYVFLHAAV